MSSESPKPSPGTTGNKVKNIVDRQKREEERLERLRLKEAEKVKKEEEKRQREEEKKRKEVEKEAERIRKEEEKKRKDEEREQERLRKEEEKRKKEEERLRKEEEKRRKEEELKQERLRKEEEKKQKEEEKEQERLKREEEKRKREDEKEQERLKKKMKLDEKEQKTRKQAEFMQSFLKKNTPVCGSANTSSASTEISMEVDSPETPKFPAMPFQVKSGMALAPIHRRPSLSLSSVRKELFSAHSQETAADVPEFEPYISEIKRRGGRKSQRTEVAKVITDNEVEIIDPKKIIENPAEAGLIKWRWKLLQFDKTRRPPYWGTWKRRATRAKPRAPFAKEEEIDYEFESDDDWEDEPEDGEDLGDKDDDDKEEDEKCSVGDDEDEDDFLVPHGYLSDDEAGVAEYRDKDTLKTLEEQFYKDLKKEKINGYPVIETDNLDQYTMIFFPNDEDESDLGDLDTDDETERLSIRPVPVAVAGG